MNLMKVKSVKRKKKVKYPTIAAIATIAAVGMTLTGCDDDFPSTAGMSPYSSYERNTSSSSDLSRELSSSNTSEENFDTIGVSHMFQNPKK